MSPLLWVVLGVVLFVALGLAFAALAPDARRLRRLRRLPPTFVMDAVEGELVKISGRIAEADAPVRTPLEERPVLYYEARVWRSGRTSSTGSSSEQLVWRQHAGAGFAVEGMHGDRAHVLPGEDLELVLAPSSTRYLGYVGTGGDDPELRVFFEEHGVASDCPQRYEELCLLPAQLVTVIGVARWRSGDDGVRRLVLVGDAAQRALVADGEWR